MKDRLKAIESAMVALVKKEESPKVSITRHRMQGRQHCRKWNSSGCSFPRCKYSHRCSSCGGDHPASRCPAHSADRNRGPQRALGAGRPY